MESVEFRFFKVQITHVHYRQVRVLSEKYQTNWQLFGEAETATRGIL